jgi:hypothetical protein
VCTNDTACELKNLFIRVIADEATGEPIDPRPGSVTGDAAAQSMAKRIDRTASLAGLRLRARASTRIPAVGCDLPFARQSGLSATFAVTEIPAHALTLS